MMLQCALNFHNLIVFLSDVVSLPRFCITNGRLEKTKKTIYIEQLLWRSPPANKMQTEPEKIVFFKKWRQDVLWLEVND